MDFRLEYILFSVLLLCINCCSPGFYEVSDSCIPCHPGHYFSKNNAYKCEKCPTNTYAFSGFSSCTPCIDGFISPWDNSHCYPCGMGSYADKKNNKCVECPAGTFANSGASKCLNCPAGTYSGSGSGHCVPCPAGTKSGEKSKSCEDCPAGTFSGSGSSMCHRCPVGTYSYYGSSTCYYCEDGKKVKDDQTGCVAGSSGNTGSTKCPAGTYLNQRSNSCEKCPKGTFSFPGSAECLKCPEGTYSREGYSNCKVCKEGSKVNGDKSGCELCPAGTYSPSRSEKCFKCLPGTYSSTGWSSCAVCREGHKSNKDNTRCEMCPAGTYSPSHSGECFKCPKGYYSNDGYSSCTPCQEGYYGDGVGLSQCKRCPENTYSYYGSTFCFKCSKESRYCLGPIERTYDDPRRYDEKEQIIEEYERLEALGKYFTNELFGVNIEFKNVNEVVTFQIPGYTVKVTIFNQLIYDLKGDIKINIENGKIKNMEAGSILYENIKTFFEKLENALSGQINIGFNYFTNKLGNIVSSGDINIGYDFLKNSLEITFLNKMKQNTVESICGVKYIITPRIDLGYVFSLVAKKVVQIKAPELFPSPDLTFEYIVENLKMMNQVALLENLYIILIFVICCMAIPFVI